MKIDLNSEDKEEFAIFAETGKLTTGFLYSLGELNDKIDDRIREIWGVMESLRMAEGIDQYTGKTDIDSWEYTTDSFTIEASDWSCGRLAHGSRDRMRRSGKITFVEFLDKDFQETARLKINAKNCITNSNYLDKRYELGLD